MGKYNSSSTRVVPVLNQLYTQDATGSDWLPMLLSIGDRAEEARLDMTQAKLIADHPRWWGGHELSLRPPGSLLRHLVQHLSSEQVERSGDQGVVLEKRRALARKDPQVIQEALSALEQGDSVRPTWYVLEGHSHPDATLIMADAVLVIDVSHQERPLPPQPPRHSPLT